MNCLLAGDSNGEGEGPDGGRLLRVHNLSKTKDKIFSKSVIDQIKLIYHEVIANLRVACFYCWKQNGSRELYSFFESSMKYLSLLAIIRASNNKRLCGFVPLAASPFTVPTPSGSMIVRRMDIHSTLIRPLLILMSMIDHPVLVVFVDGTSRKSPTALFTNCNEEKEEYSKEEHCCKKGVSYLQVRVDGISIAGSLTVNATKAIGCQDSNGGSNGGSSSREVAEARVLPMAVPFALYHVTTIVLIHLELSNVASRLMNLQ